MATYPIDPSEGWAEVPRNRWPLAVARLQPEMVIVQRGKVRIITKPYFDGGWGYEVVLNKEDLGMPFTCYDELPQSVYWHGPC